RTVVMRVTDAGEVAATQVVTGLADSRRVQILTGLASGDVVLADARQPLPSGARIHPRVAPVPSRLPPPFATPSPHARGRRRAPRRASPPTAPTQRASSTMWISNTSIQRPVFATMVIMSFMVLGIVSMGRLGIDLFPEVNFPF